MLTFWEKQDNEWGCFSSSSPTRRQLEVLRKMAYIGEKPKTKAQAQVLIANLIKKRKIENDLYR